MRNREIKRAGEIAGVVAAVLVYILLPQEDKLTTLVITGTSAVMGWMYMIGLLLAIRDFDRERRKKAMMKRQRRLHIIETGKRRRDEWTQLQ